MYTYKQCIVLEVRTKTCTVTHTSHFVTINPDAESHICQPPIQTRRPRTCPPRSQYYANMTDSPKKCTQQYIESKVKDVHCIVIGLLSLFLRQCIFHFYCKYRLLSLFLRNYNCIRKSRSLRLGIVE